MPSPLVLVSTRDSLGGARRNRGNRRGCSAYHDREAESDSRWGDTNYTLGFQVVDGESDDHVIRQIIPYLFQHGFCSSMLKGESSFLGKNILIRKI